jgi:hypothetical protein
MKKTVLLATDKKKYDVLIAERQSMANEINEGIQYLKSLDFVSEVSEPDPEDPIGWWHNEIIQTVKPKRIAGLKPNPKQLALSYNIDYEGVIKAIHSYPWNATSLVDMVDGLFVVSAKIEKEVLEMSSTYGTPEQAAEFEKLDVLLTHLNEYCSKFISDKQDLNGIATGLRCKYFQLPDRTYKIVPDYRVILHFMNRGTTNL